MSTMWKRLDALAGRAVTASFGEAVLVQPTKESEYTEAAPDASRPPASIRGIFGLEHGDDDLRGQRLRGEFAGISRLIDAAAHLQITAAQYAELGYTVVRGDRVSLTDRTGSPVYSVAQSMSLDSGDVLLILTRVT